MYMNQNLPLPRAGRYATTNKDLLIKAIMSSKSRWDFENDDNASLEDKVSTAVWNNISDLSIDIDAENIYPWPGQSEDITEDTITYIGKIPVLELEIGGDWQCPAAIILYADPKGKVRLYFPKKGNMFNPKKKCALEEGSDDYESLKDYLSGTPQDEDEWYNEVEIDYNSCEQDAAARLIPVD